MKEELGQMESTYETNQLKFQEYVKDVKKEMDIREHLQIAN